MKRLLKLLRGAGWLNVIGMTLAFAAIYIISVQVHYEFGYNQKIPHIERIYLMAMNDRYDAGKYSIHMSRPFAKRILDQMPMVETYCAAWGAPVGTETVITGEGENAQSYQVQCLQLSSPGVKLFGMTPIAGSFDDLGNGHKVAISQHTATRLGVGVGDVLAIGTPDSKRTVAAIYHDLQKNSTLYGAEIFYSDVMDYANLNNASEWSTVHYIKLNSSQDKAEFEKQAFELLVNETKQQGVDTLDNEVLERLKITLIPLESIYFENRVSGINMGNKATTITLLVMAILILLITLINYVNFFLAQVPIKLKSVNMRKILGSTRSALVFRFMMESGFLVLISMALAVVVVLLFRDSSYAQFVTTDMSFGKNPFVVCITFFSGLLLTIVSSVYPALYITSFPPALALKGAMMQSRAGRSFRYILVGFQFFISMVFIISTFFVKKQYDFMMNYDMGFNKADLYTLNVDLDWSNRDLAEELLQNGVIQDITWADGSLVNVMRMGWGRRFHGKQISFNCYPVAHNFLRFMGIGIQEGRDFSPADEQCENGIFIFNPEAKAHFGLTLQDQVYGHMAPTDIAGFSNEFLFLPLQYDNETFAFYVFGKKPWRNLNHVYLRARPHASRAEVQQTVTDFVTKCYPGINVEEVNVITFDEELGKHYEKEENLVKLIALFSVFAIFISLVGVVGLLMFETAYRRKEIGIHRVNGAQVSEILQMFNVQFLKIALVSFVCATPVCYALTDYYLSQFAYRTTISWWVFALAFGIICLITLVVVTLCSYRAASENPCLSLQNE